ncbi:chromate efflux transporter [Rhodovibrionaceae bacterium A322]
MTAPNQADPKASDTAAERETAEDRQGKALTKPDFHDAFRVFGKIGLLSFGGPTAQIALMHRVIVDEEGWLKENQFLSALSFCMLLPGPEAMQLATYSGWRLLGLRGGLLAGLLFVLPGAVLILALAACYALFGELPLVQAVFLGIKSAVLIIVIEALLRISKRALKRPAHWILAGASFVALFFLSLPFPLVIAMAALIGLLLAWNQQPPAVVEASEQPSGKGIGQTVRIFASGLTIWMLPLILMSLLLGPDHVLAQLGWFFSKLAVVTFGGAYAVLTYMAQDVVQHYGWLSAGEMMDSLGLAETTNGPLILVTEFVGFLAAARAEGEINLWMGLAGAAVTLWVTFVPCFIWIFAGAPYIERLQNMPRLSGALSGVTAAVVGVMLNLSLWFGLHVFFEDVAASKMGPLTLWQPMLESLNWLAVGLALVAAGALLRFRLGVASTLGLVGALSLAAQLLV